MNRACLEVGRVVAALALLVACGDDDADGATTTTTGAQGGSGNAGATGGQGGQGATGGTGGDAGGGGEGGMRPCENTIPPNADIPAQLSATGLYADIGTKELGPAIREFTPQFALWSDGAEKTRWIYLPECEQIDSADMDFWQLPIGTRLWKEFVVGGIRIETRMLHRVGPDKTDWLFAAYQWNAEQSDAQHVPDGVDNASGTTHQIPSQAQCMLCHGGANQGGTPSRALGFTALQLSHAGAGVPLSELIANDKLTEPPAGNFTVPGNAIESAAFGYLHANCGNCHNASPDGVAFVSMQLFLPVGELGQEVSTLSLYTSTVDQATTIFTSVPERIDPGNPAGSAVFVRMDQRGTNAQMPPLSTGGSKVVDPTGTDAVEAWICSLGGIGACP